MLLVAGTAGGVRSWYIATDVLSFLVDRYFGLSDENNLLKITCQLIVNFITLLEAPLSFPGVNDNSDSCDTIEALIAASQSFDK